MKAGDSKNFLIALLLAAFSLLTFSKEDNSWFIEQSRSNPFQHLKQPSKITVTLRRESISRGEVSISIYINRTLVYSFTGETSWRTADKNTSEFSFAEMLVADLLSDKSLKNCNELMPVSNDWADVKLLVSQEKYNKLKTSDCMIFIHKESMERWKTILIPGDGSKPYHVNWFGV